MCCALLCGVVPVLQTKGVQNTRKIDQATAAWIAAAAAGGCAIVGTALLWPFMRRNVRR